MTSERKTRASLHSYWQVLHGVLMSGDLEGKTAFAVTDQVTALFSSALNVRSNPDRTVTTIRRLAVEHPELKVERGGNGQIMALRLIPQESPTPPLLPEITDMNILLAQVSKTRDIQTSMEIDIRNLGANVGQLNNSFRAVHSRFDLLSDRLNAIDANLALIMKELGVAQPEL